MKCNTGDGIAGARGRHGPDPLGGAAVDPTAIRHLPEPDGGSKQVRHDRGGVGVYSLMQVFKHASFGACDLGQFSPNSLTQDNTRHWLTSRATISYGGGFEAHGGHEWGRMLCIFITPASSCGQPTAMRSPRSDARGSVIHRWLRIADAGYSASAGEGRGLDGSEWCVCFDFQDVTFIHSVPYIWHPDFMKLSMQGPTETYPQCIGPACRAPLRPTHNA